MKEGEETTVGEEKKGKRKWGSLILNFLMYGGGLLVVGLIVGIVIMISVLSR